MPQEKNQTQQEATVISSQAKEKLSTHLNQVSENSGWINIHTHSCSYTRTQENSQFKDT